VNLIDLLKIPQSPSRFVVLTQARCGSTTMARLMSVHPKVRNVVREPFRYRNNGLDKSIERCDKELYHFYEIENRFGRYDGVKIQFHRVRRKRVIEEWLLKENMRLIVLFRRNVLRMAVSMVLADRTMCWAKGQLSLDYPTMKFEKISCRSLYECMSWFQGNMRLADEIADSVGGLKVYYEDFFLHDGWIKTLPQIYEFCGLEPVITTKARRLMTTQRINHEGIYRNIANVYEIEKKLGSDETGWLFDHNPPLLL
jgi:hypothetical protein